MVDDALAADLMSEARRFGMDALVEVHDEAEMARAGRLGATLVGVNNRDLKTFITDLAITERLGKLAPVKFLAGNAKAASSAPRTPPASPAPAPGPCWSVKALCGKPT